jgi:hypothetical protein
MSSAADCWTRLLSASDARTAAWRGWRVRPAGAARVAALVCAEGLGLGLGWGGA